VNVDPLLRVPTNESIGGTELRNVTGERDAPREASRGTPCAHRARHVAVVDDEVMVCKSLQRLLRSAGFEVEMFLSGRQFLESLSQRVPDCLILDMQMPGLTGLHVQRDLFARETLFPVIVITGRDEPGLEQTVLTAGAAAFLLKPVNDTELLGTIRRLLALGYALP
jgi:FixJ family two-component response regulator